MTLEHALELRARCDYRGALASLAEADDAEALLERSRLRENLGDYEGAERDARLALAKVAGSAHEGSALARLAAAARARHRPRDAVGLIADVGGAEARLEHALALEELARFDEAEAVLRAVESDEPRIRHGVRLARGAIARGRGDYAAAERELRRAIVEADEDFGPESIEKAEALNALGMVFKYAGRFDAGIELYEQALGILERGVGSQHPDVASIYHNLGGIEHARRDFQRAEVYARRSVEIRRQVAGSDPCAVAEDEAALASILHALGRGDEAETLLRRALDVLPAALGPGHPEVAAAWNNLGAVLQRRGEYAAADDAFRHALDAKERTVGREHPSLAITLNNLGVNARRLGRAAEAEAYYRRALAILERRVEDDHPNLLLTRRNYARLVADAREETQAGPRLGRRQAGLTERE